MRLVSDDAAKQAWLPKGPGIETVPGSFGDSSLDGPPCAPAPLVWPDPTAKGASLIDWMHGVSALCTNGVHLAFRLLRSLHGGGVDLDN